MIFIIGSITTALCILVQKLQKSSVQFALCTKLPPHHSAEYAFLRPSYPFYNIAFNDIEAFLQNNKSEITCILNLSPLDLPAHTDPNLLNQVIFSTSQKLWLWCAEHKKRYIYASSPTTYDCEKGTLHDEWKHLKNLKPKSTIGWLHHCMDLWVHQMLNSNMPKPVQTIAFKPFHVYGKVTSPLPVPLIDRWATNISEKKAVSIEKSHHDDFQDGMYIKHFLHMEDYTSMLHWILLSDALPSTIVNLAHDQGYTLENAAQTTAAALEEPHHIIYNSLNKNSPEASYHPIERPSTLHLRSLGYNKPLLSLKQGVKLSYCSSGVT
ncbi:MAG: NAD-dependent epimerase/dehydratase family protein [Alphaproteobacteria bacterium]|nr:NAD-dependent epimerase/dehydratase family protein [Alphaproteobacteria bacterium]